MKRVLKLSKHEFLILKADLKKHKLVKIVISSRNKIQLENRRIGLTKSRQKPDCSVKRTDSRLFR